MQYSSTPQDGLALCEGDPNEGSFAITQVTYDRLMREPDGMDLVALWMFYAYTARWQKTNQARASLSYVRKGTKWCESKVQRVKNKLVDMGLLENIRKNDTEGKVTGWFVKVRYLAKSTPSKSEDLDAENQSRSLARGGENGVQMLSNSHSKCSRTNTPLAPEGEWGEDSQDPEIPSPSTTTAPEPSPPVARSPLPWVPNDEQKRINRWFGRRDSTRWDDKELRAYRKLPDTTPEEWDLLEHYTTHAMYARNSVKTLLNNWAGDIDRARKWAKDQTMELAGIEAQPYRKTFSL